MRLVGDVNHGLKRSGEEIASAPKLMLQSGCWKEDAACFEAGQVCHCRILQL